MTGDDSDKPPAAKEHRAARLAAALRQNLRRRKAQARAAADPDARLPVAVPDE